MPDLDLNQQAVDLIKLLMCVFMTVHTVIGRKAQNSCVIIFPSRLPTITAHSSLSVNGS